MFGHFFSSFDGFQKPRDSGVTGWQIARVLDATKNPDTLDDLKKQKTKENIKHKSGMGQRVNSVGEKTGEAIGEDVGEAGVRGTFAFELVFFFPGDAMMTSVLRI